ncbi:DNA polymerase I, partial [mine drainage metagenome]
GKKFQTAYMSVDLGGREICAFGINAALSYQDQSTGADILGEAMHTLRVEHPEIFRCIANQVHDELVLHVPEDRGIEYQSIVVDVMIRAADKFLGPYGVKTEVSPTLDSVWKKD